MDLQHMRRLVRKSELHNRRSARRNRLENERDQARGRAQAYGNIGDLIELAISEARTHDPDDSVRVPAG